MLALLPLLGLAFATHVTTYDVNNRWTKPPFSGLESLVVDPAVVVDQLKPVRGPLPAGVEKVDNQAARGEKAIVFTNPMSSWAEIAVDGLPIGTIGPYSTTRLEGMRIGTHTITLKIPTGHSRTFAVSVAPPARLGPVAVNVTRTKLDLSDNIYFEYDSATIHADSYGLLDAVAKALLAHPEVLVLRVEGHTDSQGDADYNQKLSESRAGAVRQYLVKAGVPADRLTAAGFGESKPLDPSDTEAAWEKNRRVEFVVEKHLEDEQPVAEPAPEPPKKGKKK